MATPKNFHLEASNITFDPGEKDKFLFKIIKKTDEPKKAPEGIGLVHNMFFEEPVRPSGYYDD